MGLSEEYQAFLERQSLSREYAEHVAKQQRDKDLAAGGSITQAPIERLPIGATIGGTVGAIGAGVATSGNPLAIFGGGVAGTIAGELGQQGVEYLLDWPGKVQSARESAGRVGEEAFYSILGEGVGALGGHAIGLVLKSPLSARITPEAHRALQYLDQYAPSVKPSLMPQEATESRGLDVLGNIAESSFFGGNTVFRYRKNREAVMQGLADSLADQFGGRLTKDEFGRVFMQAVEGNKQIARAPAKVLYNSIDEALQPVEQKMLVPVATKILGPTGEPLTRLEEVTQMVPPIMFSLKEVQQKMAPLAELAKKMKRLEGEAAGDDMATAIVGMPERVSYAEIQSLRSRLLAKQEKLQVERKGSPAIRVAGESIGLLTREMDRTLERFSPELNAIRKEADQIWRQGSRDFGNRFVRSLFRKGMEEFGGEPSAIADSLLRSGEVNRIKLARKAVGEQNWQKVQSIAIQDILIKGQDSQQVLNGNKMMKALIGRTGYSNDKLQAIFTPEQVHNFKEFANALTMQQRKSAGAGGSFLIQVTQAGALMDLVGVFGDSDIKPISVGLLLGPELLAKALTNPRSAKFLLEGMRMPRTARTAGQVAGQLSASLFPRSLTTPPQQPKTQPLGQLTAPQQTLQQ